MDFERVYTSDMKKMVKWFEILRSNNIEIKAPAMEEDQTDAADSAVVATESSNEPVEEAKPKKEAKKKRKRTKRRLP